MELKPSFSWLLEKRYNTELGKDHNGIVLYLCTTSDFNGIYSSDECEEDNTPDSKISKLQSDHTTDTGEKGCDNKSVLKSSKMKRRHIKLKITPVTNYHPLLQILPKIKESRYNLFWASFIVPKVNTEHFKESFINRIILVILYRYKRFNI